MTDRDITPRVPFFTREDFTSEGWNPTDPNLHARNELLDRGFMPTIRPALNPDANPSMIEGRVDRVSSLLAGFAAELDERREESQRAYDALVAEHGEENVEVGPWPQPPTTFEESGGVMPPTHVFYIRVAEPGEA